MRDDIERLTIPQARTLARIIEGLRAKGFDPDGAGLYCPNLHVGAPDPAGGVDFWLDGDDGFANGRLDADGHGRWWLRRAYAPSLTFA